MLADITSVVNSPIVMRTVISTLDSVNKNGLINSDDTDDSKMKTLFGQSFDSNGEGKKEILTSRILHKTNGPVPRSYLPSLMVIDQIDANIVEAAVFAIIEEGMQWYFDSGGRASRIEISCPTSLSVTIQSMGFYLSEESQDSDVIQLRNLDVQDGDGRCLLSCDAAKFKDYCEKRVLIENTNTYSLYDIIGRLSHDLGDPSGAIKPYTSSLQVNPKPAATFRNLGSAYHAIGDVKLAFACFQQAIEIDKSDALVYLKLAFFYEEFATKDWIDAFEHSRKCYEHYLERVDPDDTAILTRLGNLLVKEFKPVEAIEIYTKVLELNKNLDNVWYNKANAQLSINDKVGAIQSFEKVVDLDADNFIASHMLISLSEEKSEKAIRLNNLYVQNLFNDYAGVYDSHMKKLLYSAPRVLRQELATFYRGKFNLFDGRYGSDGTLVGLEVPIDQGVVLPVSDKAFAAGVRKVSTVTRVGPSSSIVRLIDESESLEQSSLSYSSYMNKTLNILDLGCGTGSAGAWLKDYAKTLIGVDLSPNMLIIAKKKNLYQELYEQPLNTYLQDCSVDFDLVVAADVLSYIGDLGETFCQVSKVLRPGGCFAFTVETALPDIHLTDKGYKLLNNGRFGYEKTYIDGLISNLKTRHSIHLSREFSPRLDVGVPVPGFLYIIKKDE